MTSIRIGLVTSLLVCGCVSAQGNFDLDDIPGVGQAPTVQIDMNQQMLNFVRIAAAASDPNAAEALAGINRVRVRVYDTLEDPAAVAAFVDDSSQRLDREGWQPAVSIQDEGNRVRMYVRFDGDNVSGMTFMVVDEEDAVFIDIDGTIDPAMLGQLTKQMGIDGVVGNLGSAFLPAVQAAAEQGAAGAGND